MAERKVEKQTQQDRRTRQTSQGEMMQEKAEREGGIPDEDLLKPEKSAERPLSEEEDQAA